MQKEQLTEPLNFDFVGYTSENVWVNAGQSFWGSDRSCTHIIQADLQQALPGSVWVNTRLIEEDFTMESMTAEVWLDFNIQIIFLTSPTL